MPLFTIGHSTHDWDRFFGLLQLHDIEVVADVRSRPFSKFPWFSRPGLEKTLRAAGIRYVFLGEELGARRTEESCYIGNRADYDRIAQTPAFQRGMERLRDGTSRFRVALLSTKKDPLDCHRALLLSRHAKEFAEISHIHSEGSLESHTSLEARMAALYRTPDADLFHTSAEILEDAYQRRGEEASYRRQPGRPD